MAAQTNPMLSAAVKALRAKDVAFALVHESALMGWGVDNNAFLESVDVLLLDDEDFRVLDVDVPSPIGRFTEAVLDDVPIRLWSRMSLGLRGGVEVTHCARYDCEALAPELVLQKLPYSPDARMLMEQRARLASILLVDTLSDDELALIARYVRGD